MFEQQHRWLDSPEINMAAFPHNSHTLDSQYLPKHCRENAGAMYGHTQDHWNEPQSQQPLSLPLASSPTVLSWTVLVALLAVFALHIKQAPCSYFISPKPRLTLYWTDSAQGQPKTDSKRRGLILNKEHTGVIVQPGHPRSEHPQP